MEVCYDRIVLLRIYLVDESWSEYFRYFFHRALKKSKKEEDFEVF